MHKRVHEAPAPIGAGSYLCKLSNVYAGFLVGAPGLEPRCGRIYKAVSHAPREAPWFWGLDFFEWQGSDGPQYGNAADREAAMKAFRAAWDRRPRT